MVHSDIVAPYISNYGTEEQKERYLPGMVRGDLIGAIAMTEPSAGSDLQSLRTVALQVHFNHSSYFSEVSLFAQGFMNIFRKKKEVISF